MIDDFEPYMSTEQVELFRGYLLTVDAANAESIELHADLVAAGALAEDDTTTLIAVSQLNDSWAAVDADMTDLIDRMEANIDNYEAVAALPSFDLFPWFFVVPGALVAGLAVFSLRRRTGDGEAATTD